MKEEAKYHLCPNDWSVSKTEERLEAGCKSSQDACPQRNYISASELPYLLPTMAAWHKGKGFGEAYIDGGAQICVITQSCVERLGLKISHSSSFHIRMANHSKVKTLGIVPNLEIEPFSVACRVDCHVMLARLGTYPLFLKRPWLRKVGAIQNWQKGIFSVHSNGKKLNFNMVSRDEVSSTEVRKKEVKPASP